MGPKLIISVLILLSVSFGAGMVQYAQATAAITDFLGEDDVGNDVALQADGKIVAVGTAYTGTNSDFALARYTSGGIQDITFGPNGNGEVTTDVGVNDLAFDVAIQADGKIVVAGGTDGGSSNSIDFAVLRYASDGSLDTSFGTGGIVITDFTGTGQHEWAFTLAIQTDGKIVVAGFAFNYWSNTNDFALARYNSDGSQDLSYIVFTDFYGGTDMIFAVEIQQDGKVVAVGSSDNMDDNDFALARYNSDGTPDLSFSNDGKLITDWGTTDIANSVTLQPDGKIVVAGYSGHPNIDFALARYDSYGNLDVSFSNDGKVKTDFAGKTDSANAVIIQPDGKIVAAGLVYRTSTSDFAVARYNPNGTLDNSFSNDGKATANLIEGDQGRGIILQQNGKIVVAGSANMLTRGLFNFALIRYLPNGVLDTQFGNW